MKYNLTNREEIRYSSIVVNFVTDYITCGIFTVSAWGLYP